LAQRAGDVESAALLLTAVPPGVHASVSGDLFPDPLEVPPGAGAPGALRRVRERLEAVSTGAAEREPAPEAARAAAPVGALLREGDGWTVRFAGRTARVRPMK